MMTNAKVGVAVVGGYLLGRTKKAKVAMGLGMFLAGRRMKLDPQQIKNLVTESPVLAGLNDQVRRELVDATKSAAGSALTKRANSLADSLKERTLGLNEPSSESGGPERDDEFLEEDDEAGAAREEAEPEQDFEPDDREPDDSERADSERADSERADSEPDDSGPENREPAGSREKPARSSSASAKKGKPATGTAGRRAPKSGGSSGRTGRAASAGGSASGARSTAGKAASGTRKATGGAARKAATRGGDNG